jgi:hypothetical protein
MATLTIVLFMGNSWSLNVEDGKYIDAASTPGVAAR